MIRLLILLIIIQIEASGQGGIMPYLVSKKGISVSSGATSSLAGKNIVVFGDSYPAGYGVASGEKWPTLLAGLTSGIEVNHAVGGAVAQPTVLCRSDLDESLIPDYDTTYGVLIIAMGLNDANINNGAGSSSGYQSALTVFIDTCIARSWPAAKILVVPPAWIPQAGRDAYIGICSTTTAQTESGQETYVAAASSAASSRSTLYIDVYNSVKSDSNKLTYISADQYHYNATGHNVLANLIFAAL